MLSSEIEGISPPSISATAEPTDRLADALWLIAQGLTLILLRSRSKEPYTPDGRWITSDRAEDVVRWFAECPDANVGIVCSPETRTVIVDADYYKGPEGSPEGLDLPQTLTTAGNGLQFVYRTDGRRVRTTAPGRRFVQVLGSKRQYGAAPPSVHPGDPKKGQAPFPYRMIERAAPGMAAEWVYITEEEAALLDTDEDRQEGPVAPGGKAPEAWERPKAERLLGAIQRAWDGRARHERDFKFALVCAREGISFEVFADLVRALPRSKARVGGAREGARYLRRTWDRAVREVRRTEAPSRGVPAEVDEWARRVQVVQGLEGTAFRVLVGLAAFAVQCRSMRVTVSNRDLRLLANVTSGSAVSQALLKGEKMGIVRMDQRGIGEVATYILKPIRDGLLFHEPPQALNLSTVKGMKTKEPLARKGPTSASLCLDVPDLGLHEAAPPHPPFPPTMSLSGSEMTPSQDPIAWVIPVDHPAFHQRMLGGAALRVLLALSDGALRAGDLVDRSGLTKKTAQRARDRLIEEGLVVKEGNRYEIRSLQPLEDLALRPEVANARHRAETGIALERDAWREPDPSTPSGASTSQGAALAIAAETPLSALLARRRGRPSVDAERAAQVSRRRSDRLRARERARGTMADRLVNFPCRADPDWSATTDWRWSAVPPRNFPTPLDAHGSPQMPRAAFKVQASHQAKAGDWQNPLHEVGEVARSLPSTRRSPQPVRSHPRSGRSRRRLGDTWTRRSTGAKRRSLVG